MAERRINAVVADSTSGPMPADQVGATAPILTAIELQVQHYRYVHRLGMNAVLEAIFPAWVRGAIRSDLSRRLGVDLIDVNDARVAAWFRDRAGSPQFVNNYQDWMGELTESPQGPPPGQFFITPHAPWEFV